MLGRRVETDTAAPDGHSGGGFTVADTGRVYRRSRLAGHEYYRVLDCVTAKARTANRR